jgi:hypothetical protein
MSQNTVHSKESVVTGDEQPPIPALTDAPGWNEGADLAAKSAGTSSVPSPSQTIPNRPKPATLGIVLGTVGTVRCWRRQRRCSGPVCRESRRGHLASGFAMTSGRGQRGCYGRETHDVSRSCSAGDAVAQRAERARRSARMSADTRRVGRLAGWLAALDIELAYLSLACIAFDDQQRRRNAARVAKPAVTTAITLNVRADDAARVPAGLTSAAAFLATFDRLLLVPSVLESAPLAGLAYTLAVLLHTRSSTQQSTAAAAQCAQQSSSRCTARCCVIHLPAL